MPLKKLIRLAAIPLCAVILLLAWLVSIKLAAPVVASDSAIKDENPAEVSLSLSSAAIPIPVVSNPANQYQHVMASDGAGGAIVAWTDTRTPPTDTVSLWWEGETAIYAQRVLSSGNVSWALDGVPVVDLMRPISEVFYLHSQPAIVSDGLGGALVAFINEAGDHPGVYIQRIDGSGELVWRDRYRYGHELANTSAPLMEYLAIASDGTEGAIVVWGLFTDKGGRLYAQRVGKSGEKLWAAPVPIFTTYQNDIAFDPQIIADGSGGAIIVWDDFRSGAIAGIYAQRLNKDGNKLWGADGKPLAEYTSDDPTFRPLVDVVAAEDGGAYVTWEADYSGQTNIYVQAMDGGGEPRWSTDMLLSHLSGQDSTAGEPVISLDGSGGVYVAWRQGNPSSIRAQRVNSQGWLQWSDFYPYGLNLSTDSAYLNNQHPQIVPDGVGGAFVAWECSYTDGTNLHRQVCTQHFNQGSALLCSPIGVEIAGLLSSNIDLGLIAAHSQQAIAAWKDLPEVELDQNYDIFAQLVNSACQTQWQGLADVMVRDNLGDTGASPTNPPWWNSPDVWVRNTDDGVEQHQDPLEGQENTIYVRVGNRGTTIANDIDVQVYSSSPGLGLVWPADWTEIGSVNIPMLDPQSSQVITLSWLPPAPSHVCLFIRLVTPDDPIVVEGAVSLENNLAQKNIDIIEIAGEIDAISGLAGLDSQESVFDINNPEDQPVVADLIIELDAFAVGGTISLDLGSDLLYRWQAAAGELQGAQLLADSTSILVTSPVSASVLGIPLEAAEQVPLTATITAPSTQVNWLSIDIWERIAGDALGGLVLQAPENYDLSTSEKQASVSQAMRGDVITYTLLLTNLGNLDHPAVTVVDTLPMPLTYVSGSLSWSAGQGAYIDGTLWWTGPVSRTQVTSITYQAIVNALATTGKFITNTASMDDGINPLYERSFVVEILASPTINLYHPLIYKGR